MRRRYDAEAPRYDQARFGTYRGALARRVKDDAIRSLLQEMDLLRPNARILDAATGTGRLLRALAGTGPRFVGVDVSDPMLRECRAHTPSETDLYRCDLSRLAFADDSFDAALLGSFLYLIPADRYASFLDDLRRVLRPGAPLICEVANSRTAFNPVNMARIARYRRRHRTKSYVTPGELDRWLPDWRCERVVGVEYPVWCPAPVAGWLGRRRAFRGLGGKYVAVLRSR